MQLQHSQKIRKVSLETRAALLMLLLEFIISGVSVQRIHQNCKKTVVFRENFFSGNDLETVFCDLAILCCYNYGENTSEVVERFTTD